MKALVALANRVKGISVNSLLEVLGNNKSFTDYIIELNTRNQLFDKGVNADGVKLSDIGGDYSGVTMDLAEAKGKPKRSKDHIDLNDTGEFYESFRAFYKQGEGFVISADTIKDTSDLVADWGAAILGLNEDSLEKLRIKAKIILIPYVRKKILER